ncbi:MAG: hypothetical protein KIS96_14705 [Bauldia sp.]|nr:hypothetical protein [Bauldia sp.]
MKARLLVAAAIAGAAWAGLSGPAAAQNGDAAMTFFITSVGMGNGGDLGGLAGADAYCQSLAEAAGAGSHTWRAYLSTIMDDSGPGENARDRIGEGPWHNAAGVQIAADLDELHSDAANINKETALNENGGLVNGRGDEPNEHDILTGTKQDGTVADEGTCANWTSSSDDATAAVGHHDLVGNPAGINFWNYSHSTAGCSQDALVRTGGAGLLYCFAID